ncbi:hypothetical protein ABIE69_001055 [Rhodobacteraceae bacterium MBR-64]|jgi:hypothetical protein
MFWACSDKRHEPPEQEIPPPHHHPATRDPTAATACHEWRGGQAVVFLGGRVLHQTSFANEPLGALSPPGIDHLDMPTMPDRIRQAITAASVGG